MSIDFDGAALPTQQEEEEEYDQEDYAREQELHKLLTDLPDDMLEDSRDASSPEPDHSACVTQASDGRTSAAWNTRTKWNDERGLSRENDESNYGQGSYHDDYAYDHEAERFNGHLDQHHGWAERQEESQEYMYDSLGYTYPSMGPEQSTAGGEFGQYHHIVPQRGDLGYGEQTSSGQHIQPFDAKGSGDNCLGHYKVTYNPYQPASQQKLFSPEVASTSGRFDQLQREFLDSAHNSTDQQQIAQLQILNKAQLRQIEDLEKKLEDCRRNLRYLEHQLAMVKDEKEGLAVSLKESGHLLEEAKERELKLQAKVKALEVQVQTAADRERESSKKQRAAEVALDSLQQQMAELCRSETLTRARQQHDRDLVVIREQHEAHVLALQQRLDAQTRALEGQEELAHRLQEQLEQLQREREEEKLERAAVINSLTQRLEESQQQCAGLLQTGTIQEMNQLRIQLQHAQSAKTLSDNINRSLQEELTDLKEQITLYESAVKLGAISLDTNREWENQLSDSYVELGIKKVNWKNSRFHSGPLVAPAVTDTSAGEDVLGELKAELQRLLGSLKTKRQKISQLQGELQQARGQTQELQAQLDAAERSARDSRVRETALEKHLEASSMAASQEELQQLQKDREHLQGCVEKLEKQNQELKQSEEKVRAANLELCTKMREMIQELDQEKQEAAARYERTQQQFRDDVVNHVRAELTQEHVAEMEALRRESQQEMQQLESKLEDVSKQMEAVQECYISVCREKDVLEQSLRAQMEEEQRKRENELRSKMEREKEVALAQLEARHSEETSTSRELWMKEREEELRRQVAMEKERAQQLEQAGRGASIESNERAIQTEGVGSVLFQAELEAQLTTQRLTLQEEAEKARTKAVMEVEQRVQRELHSKHLEAVGQQVESALSRARERWLQEMTSLPEYQASLQAHLAEWERQQQHLAQKEQGCKERVKLQEELQQLRRQLEQSREEQDARSRAEMAQAQAAWKRDRQEEVARLQAHHEQDYRALLDEQRGKLAEALALAKAEAGRLQEEAVRQKEADLLQLLRSREEEMESRSGAERERLWEEALAEMRIALEEIRKRLMSDPKWLTWNEEQSPASPQVSGTGETGKLTACLQVACRALLRQVVAQAKQSWEEVSEDKLVRALKEAKELHEKEMDRVRASLWHGNERVCSPGCADRLQQLQKRCQDLQRHLEKACRQLRQAVRNHEVAVQRLKEEHDNAMQREREAAQQRASGTQQPCSTESSQPCGNGRPDAQQSLQDGLEEMRQQYMKAVGKIRGDMLRYIQESKARAAQMIRAEVLRERQDTARKMRHYYLTCLQELLEDGGKAQGAEKKIFNAASKLAAMAKVLETPVSKKQSGRSLTTLTTASKSDSPAVEKSAKTLPVLPEQSPPAKDVNSQSNRLVVNSQQGLSLTVGDGKPGAEHSGFEKNKHDCQTTGSKAPHCVLITSDKRKVLDGAHTRGSLNPSGFLSPRPVGQLKSIPSVIAARDGPQAQAHVTLSSQSKEMQLGGGNPNHAAESEVKPLIVKEAPVRDGGQNDRSLASVGAHYDHQNPALHSITPLGQDVGTFPFPAPSIISISETKDTDDDLSHFGNWSTYKNIPTVLTRPKVKAPPTVSTRGWDTDMAKTRELIPGSEGERLRQLCSKSLFSETKACQQDSGFDSPVSLLPK